MLKFFNSSGKDADGSILSLIDAKAKSYRILQNSSSVNFA
ncbi:Uncharacterised protein [Vibrio cholerae]|nr:Uncharacterised protein [Vibrio cholerae]